VLAGHTGHRKKRSAAGYCFIAGEGKKKTLTPRKRKTGPHLNTITGAGKEGGKKGHRLTRTELKPPRAPPVNRLSREKEKKKE